MTFSRHSLSWFRCALHVAPLVVAVALGGSVRAQIAPAAPQRSAQTAVDARAAAECELERSRSDVAEARAAAIAAKAVLDAVVSASQHDTQPGGEHSSTTVDSGRADATAGASGPGGSNKSTVQSKVAGATQAETDLLKKLIADLQAEREQLLTHLTPAHPLIVDADLRLEEYQQHLAALARGQRGTVARQPVEGAEATKTPGVNEGPSPPSPQMAHLPQGGPAKQQEIAARLEEAFARWEAAQQELLSAMDAESAAAERLAALAARSTMSEPPATASVPVPVPSETRTGAVASADTTTTESGGRSPSKWLVLTALMVALVIAAVAAVKLARASDETVFAGADDAAATLALPIVGVIPVVGPAWAHRSVFERYRKFTFLGQMLLAVVVFALVAYCVQNPALLWQLCTDPLEVLRPTAP